MLIFTCEGNRSVDDAGIIHVFADDAPGRYASCTVVLDDGSDVPGLALKDALAKLEAKLSAAA